MRLYALLSPAPSGTTEACCVFSFPAASSPFFIWSGTVRVRSLHKNRRFLAGNLKSATCSFLKVFSLPSASPPFFIRSGVDSARSITGACRIIGCYVDDRAQKKGLEAPFSSEDGKTQFFSSARWARAKSRLGSSSSAAPRCSLASSILPRCFSHRPRFARSMAEPLSTRSTALKASAAFS